MPIFDQLLDKAKTKAPTRSLVRIQDVEVAVVFLARGAARVITSESFYIEIQYHVID